MNQVTRALTEFQEMDSLAAMDTPIHRLHPLVKLLTTLLYVFLVVSFPKYNMAGLLPMVIFPALLFSVTGIPVKTCFYKLRLVLPLVCAVGLFNPIFDREILLQLGSVAISGGVISMLTLMLKGIFSLMASFLLIATTPMDSLCLALRRLHVPSILVTLLLLTYRYVGLMIEEVSIMTDAYHLRAPGQKGIHYKAWGSFVGQLLLRTMDRATELYQSMQLRGFQGEFPHAKVPPCKGKDLGYLLLIGAGCCALRFLPIAELFGRLVVS